MSSETCQVLIKNKPCGKPGGERWLLKNTENGSIAEVWVCDDHREVAIV